MAASRGVLLSFAGKCLQRIDLSAIKALVLVWVEDLAPEPQRHNGLVPVLSAGPREEFPRVAHPAMDAPIAVSIGSAAYGGQFEKGIVQAYWGCEWRKRQ